MKPITRNERRLLVFAILSAGLLAGSVSSRGASMTFNINANGAKEVTAAGVPNQGDPDGSAIGTLTLDDGTGGSTGFAIFNLTLANIDLTSLSGHHVHQAPATTTGSIVLNFGDPDTMRSGSVISGTFNGLSSTTIDSVFANPSGFYYNIHNTPFPGGAVRDQLTPVPEPSTIALGVVAAAMGAVLMRRRSQKKA